MHINYIQLFELIKLDFHNSHDEQLFSNYQSLMISYFFQIFKLLVISIRMIMKVSLLILNNFD